MEELVYLQAVYTIFNVVAAAGMHLVCPDTNSSLLSGPAVPQFDLPDRARCFTTHGGVRDRLLHLGVLSLLSLLSVHVMACLRRSTQTSHPHWAITHFFDFDNF